MNYTIKIDASDIDPDKITEAILDELADDLEDKITDVYVDLTAPPPLGTPVDTGQARNSWQIDTTVRLEPEVYTVIPYMKNLNDGSSKQSPAGFIDAIVDKHFRD